MLYLKKRNSQQPLLIVFLPFASFITKVNAMHGVKEGFHMLKKTLVFTLISVGSLLGVLSLQTAFGEDEISDYSLNDAGETYGSALYAASSADEPDLIQAYGVDGTEGYVKKVDLDGHWWSRGTEIT